MAHADSLMKPVGSLEVLGFDVTPPDVFVVVDTSGCPVPPFDLEPEATCGADLPFTPTGLGDFNGPLSVRRKPKSELCHGRGLHGGAGRRIGLSVVHGDVGPDRRRVLASPPHRPPPELLAR
jgi:hypothetical protein